MGWTKLETKMEKLRDELAENGEKVRVELLGLLEEHRCGSNRVRLLGLMALACLRGGRLEEALAAYEEGRRLGGTPLAIAELEMQGAELQMFRGEKEAAEEAIEISLARLKALRSKEWGDSWGAQRRCRHVAKWMAISLITRARINLNLGTGVGRLHRGLRDVLSALQIVDPRSSVRVYVSAISALGVLVRHVGSLRDIEHAMRLLVGGERILKRKKLAAKHPYRLKLRAVRSLCLAKLGAVDRAEELLKKIIGYLREKGYDADADRAGWDLIWIVAERAGQPYRAKLLHKEMRLKGSFSPEAQIPKERDSEDPIGF